MTWLFTQKIWRIYLHNAYGIMGKFSNIDPDKVYDYHTAFDINPFGVKYNVNINANNKKILNIALDKSKNASAATVGMVKKLIPFTTNQVYRQYFEQFYDFSDANIYGLSSTSSGVVFNSLVPNITFPNKHLSDIRKDGLNVNNFTINFNPSHYFTNYTLCIFFYHWSNKNFALFKNDSQNNQGLLSLTFAKAAGYLTLLSNNKRSYFSIPSSFNGKKIVLWLAESADSIVTKVSVSNYSSTLTLSTANHTSKMRSLVKYLPALEEKFRIFAQLCNIFRLSHQKIKIFESYTLKWFIPN